MPEIVRRILNWDGTFETFWLGVNDWAYTAWILYGWRGALVIAVMVVIALLKFPLTHHLTSLTLADGFRHLMRLGIYVPLFGAYRVATALFSVVRSLIRTLWSR